MAGRILVIEPSHTERMLVTSLLSANRYDVQAVDNCAAAAASSAMAEVEAVVLGPGAVPPDEALAACFAACRTVRPDGGDMTAPVLLLDPAPDPWRRLAALRAGAWDYAGARVAAALLLAQLRTVIREAGAAREAERRQAAAAALGFGGPVRGGTPAGRIALIGGGDLSGGLAGLAAAHAWDCTRLGPGEVLSRRAEATPFDLFVIDARSVPLSLLPEMRARSASRGAAILVLYGSGDETTAIRALDVGASAIVPDDATGDEQVHRVREMLRRKAAEDALKLSTEESFRLAVTDPLTGLFNRRYAQAYLDDAAEIAATTGRPFALMMVDIDHFKDINDTHGHAAGDVVLRAVAGRLREALRAIDLVARYGGEEFLVVLPGTDLSEAGPAADRLRERICGTPVAIGTGQSIPVTVSVGAAVGGLDVLQSRPRRAAGGFPRAVDLSRLIDAADTALYGAKAAGRNRTKIAVNPA